MANFYEDIVLQRYPKLNIFLVLVQIAIPSPALIWMFSTDAGIELIYAFSIFSALLLVIMWQMRRYVTQMKFKSNDYIRNLLLQKGFNKEVDETGIIMHLSNKLTGESQKLEPFSLEKEVTIDNNSFVDFTKLLLKHTIFYECLHEKSRQLLVRLSGAILLIVMLLLLSGDLIFSSTEQVIHNRIAIAIFIVIFSSSIIETYIMHEISAKKLTNIKHDLMSLILKKDMNLNVYQISIINQFGKFTDALLFAPEIYNWFSRLYKESFENEWNSALRRINL